MIFGGQEMYCLSKASLNAFVWVAARCFAQGDNSRGDAFVGFVAVCPGDVATGIADMQAKHVVAVSTAVHNMQRKLALVLDDLLMSNGLFMRNGKQIAW